MPKERSKPDNISIAVIMLWFAFGAGVISSILKFSMIVETDKASNLRLLWLIVTFLVTAFLIWKIGEGKDWARNTYVFLFILGCIVTLFSFIDIDLTSTVGKSLLILAITQIILHIIALVFLFQKQSSDWFKSMTKKKVKTHWYKTWWAIVLFIVLGLIIIVSIFENNSGQKELKEKYDVLDYFCGDSVAGVEMKSLGNRENQVREGIFYLYQDCQNSEIYSITILEPTKECHYSFNGEIIRLLYNHIGQDNLVIPEASKRIIESDTHFSFWKIFAEISYEFELKNGDSNMTGSQMILSSAYKDYLKNGITKSTLYSIMAYEMDNSVNCE